MVPKIVEGNPLGFINIRYFAKYQKKTRRYQTKLSLNCTKISPIKLIIEKALFLVLYQKCNQLIQQKLLRRLVMLLLPNAMKR